MSIGRVPVHVTDYLNLQDYLRAVFQAKKAARGTFSVRTWARSLGMSSSSQLAMVLTGKRVPNEALGTKLSHYLEHSPTDAKFFQILINLAKADPQSEDHRYLRLQAERARLRLSTKRLNRETFEAISDWYFYAIREMIQLKSFEEDPHKIHHALYERVSPEAIARAIEILVRLELLQRDGAQLKYHSGSIQIDSHQSEKGLAKYHEQILRQGADAIQQVAEEHRHVTGTTLCMKSSDIERARQMMQEFQERFIQAFENSAEGDAVFQLESLLFPLSRP